MKHEFYATKDIKADNGDVIVKDGALAVTVDTDIKLDRAFSGLQMGILVPKKDLPAPEASASKKPAEAPASK